MTKSRVNPDLQVVSRRPEAEEPQVESLIADGLRIMRRRYLLVIAVFLITIIPAVFYILRKEPQYQAAARLLVERGQEADSVLNQLRTDTPRDDFQTEASLLRSRPVVAKAIMRTKLWQSPEFALKEMPAKVDEQFALSSGLVDAFLAHLAVIPETRTNILNVAFTSTDPQTAMNATNGLVQVYIDEQASAQYAASAEVVDWLSKRLAEQKARLEESEAALQSYAESQKSVSLADRQNIVMQKLADLNQAATHAKTERMAKETLYNQVRAAQESPDALPVVLSNPVLQQLRARVAELKQEESTLSREFGDRHPTLIKTRSELEQTQQRLKVELDKVIDSVKNEYTAAQSLEQSLTQALEEQKAEVLNLSRQGVDYGALQRQATSDRQLYERLLAETQARGIAGKTIERKIRVVESAELPRQPVAPNRPRQLLLALLCSALLALSAPLVREALDHRIKTAADLEKLGIKCLSVVPKVQADPNVGPAPLFGTEATAFNEAFRRIRTAVSLSTAASPLRVMVTSAVPREGKSVVAVNLAMALAQMNQRVLLVDGDMRRPKVHRVLRMKPFPGFADLLTASASVTEAVHPSSAPNLFVLPCGTKNASTSELLASSNIDDVLGHLTKTFDCIVFDSPPTGPVADACVIGQWVDIALVVVHAESTPASVARAAIEQLRAANVPLAGAILNQVNLQYSGYYSPLYNGRYSDYYSEPKAPATKAAEV